MENHDSLADASQPKKQPWLDDNVDAQGNEPQWRPRSQKSQSFEGIEGRYAERNTHDRDGEGENNRGSRGGRYGGGRDGGRGGRYGGGRDGGRDGGRGYGSNRFDRGSRDGGRGGRDGGRGGRYGGGRDGGRDGGRGYGSNRFDRGSRGGYGGGRNGGRDWNRDGGSDGGRRFERGGGRDSNRGAYEKKGSRFGGRDRNSDRRFSNDNYRENSSDRSYGDRGLNGPAKRGSRQGRSARAPQLPDSITASQLDRAAWKQLSPLSKDMAEKVARHLVASGQLVDVEPELAYEHAHAALKMAWRIDIVREAVALTAYATGRYGEALREVRTVRRMSATDTLRSVEADSERGLGRPEKALEIVAATDIDAIDPYEAIELLIVASSARADIGEKETGLAVIEQALRRVDPQDDYYLRRVLSVKVDRLKELGRFDEAADVQAQMPPEIEQIDIIDVEEEHDAIEASNPTTLLGSQLPISQAYPNLILDLDGVTWSGSNRIQNAAEGLNQARDGGATICFVTNNASRTPDQVAQKLRDHGIQAYDEEIITSSLDGARMMQKLLEPGSKVLAVGGPGVAQALEIAGFEVVYSAQDNPAGVMQGLGLELTWAELSEVAFAVRQGAKWVSTNMDLSLPVERGFALGNGALVQAIVASTGASPIACGKPERSIYKLAEEKLTQDPCLAVGDRLDTDIAGAVNAKVPAFHVLTGVSDARDIVLAPQFQRPQFLALDLSDLNRPMPRPEPEEKGWWVCEQARARINNQDIEVERLGVLSEGDQVTLDEYRAIVAAAWYARKDIRVNCPKFTVVRELDEPGDNQSILDNESKTEPVEDQDNSEVHIEDRQKEEDFEEQEDHQAEGSNVDTDSTDLSITSNENIEQEQDDEQQEPQQEQE